MRSVDRLGARGFGQAQHFAVQVASGGSPRPVRRDSRVRTGIFIRRKSFCENGRPANGDSLRYGEDWKARPSRGGRRFPEPVILFWLWFLDQAHFKYFRPAFPSHQ